MINEEIRDKEVRLIGPDGAQLGVVSSKEALAMADENNLDLVKIAPQAKPRFAELWIMESTSLSLRNAKRNKERTKR